MKFSCNRCGICCKHIDLIPQLKEFDLGNGVCMYLTSDNLCEIYDNRPEICNVEKMYELLYKEIISKEEYIRLNIEGCKELKNRFG